MNKSHKSIIVLVGVLLLLSLHDASLWEYFIAGFLIGWLGRD